MKLPDTITGLLKGNGRDRVIVVGAVASVAGLAWIASRGGGLAAAPAPRGADPRDASQIALGPSYGPRQPSPATPAPIVTSPVAPPNSVPSVPPAGGTPGNRVTTSAPSSPANLGQPVAPIAAAVRTTSPIVATDAGGPTSTAYGSIPAGAKVQTVMLGGKPVLISLAH